MAWPITPDERERILKLRRRGLPLRVISRRTGRSVRGIQELLDRLGVPRLRADIPRRRSTSVLCTRISALAREGLTQQAVAERLGVAEKCVASAVARQQLIGDLIPLSVLSAEISVQNVEALQAFPHTKWFTRRVFTPEQAEAVRAHYAGHITVTTGAHWLSTVQAARELGMHPDTFIRMLRRGEFPEVKRAKLKGPGVRGRIWRYEPQGVLAAARRRRPALPTNYTRPGVYLVEDVAGMACRQGSAVRHWVHRHDAPHLRDNRGRIWFDLAALLPWLDAQVQPSYRRAAASIRRGTAQGQAA